MQTIPQNFIARNRYAIIIFGCIISGVLLFAAIYMLTIGNLLISLILLPFLIPFLWFTCDSIYWRIVIDMEADTMTVYRLFRKRTIIHCSEIISVKKHLIPYRAGIEYLMIRTKSQKLKVPRDVTNYEYFESFLRIDI